MQYDISPTRPMNTVSVSVPQSGSANSEGSAEDVERDSQFLLALKLFEMGRVTTTEAAGMCGMPSVDFLLAAARASQPARASVSM